MVYALIIQTLLPGTCRVLYSSIFGQESHVGDHASEQIKGTYKAGAENAESEGVARSDRKNQLFRVAQEVQSEYLFRTSVTHKSYEHDMQALLNEGRVPDFELGFIRLEKGEVFNEEKTVVWMGAVNCGFVLICEKMENRATAELVLKLLIKYLHEQCKVLTQPTEIILKPDRATLVVQHLLPAGQLIFMNHRVVRGLEKALEIKMKQ